MSKSIRYWINVAIGLALMFLFPLIPPIGPITEVGMHVLGVFLAMVYMWSTVDGIWPELLGLLVLALTGYLGEEVTGYSAISKVFTGAFGTETMMVIVLCMFLFSALEGVGLTKYIVRFFLTRKVFEGRPYVLIMVFLLCSYFISGTCGAAVSMFMLWPVALEICRKFNYQKGDKFFYVIICGVYYAATIGQPMMPFKGAIFAVLSAFNNAFGTQINNLTYLIFNIIMAVIMFLVFLAVVRFIIRPNVDALKAIKVTDVINEEIEPMNFAQKVVGIIVIATIVGVLLPLILPISIPGIGFLNTIGLLGLDCILISVAMVFKTKDGKRMINLREYNKKSFSWDIYFQVASALYVATALTSEVTGIKPAITSVIRGLLGGKPAILFVIAIILCAVLITQVANNMAMGVIFVTILAGFVADYPGLNMAALAVTVGMAVFMALLTPAASPYCSMLHAKSDVVSFKEIMKVFLPMAIAGVVVYACIGYPLACLLF